MNKRQIASQLVKIAESLMADEVLEQGPVSPETPLMRLPSMSLSEIAQIIYKDHRQNGKKIYFGAVPYLDALSSLNSISDDYGMDSGSSIVAYLLSNLSTWKGEVAKAVKKELNKRLKSGR